MNTLDFFTKTYSRLQNYPGVPVWVFTPARRMVRWCANQILPRYLAKPRKLAGHVEPGLIVSFTSFPARINEVWLVVESLKNQSVLPEKIILWLSKDQFPNKESIPISLWKEEDNLFEIRMVEGDIRSHKKFYYVMQEFPDKTFVTCDDDIYYHPDTIKHLVDCGRRFPGCVIANSTRHIQFDSQGRLLPYNQWKVVQLPYTYDNLIQIGVGGVLYPPKVLHELTLRKDLFLTLTPMADDIWLNCMARLNGTPVVSAVRISPLSVQSDSPSLSSENKGENKNDLQLANLVEFLKNNGLANVYSQEYLVVSTPKGK